jgi:O-acetyl-ADP-ribose deacetylase (regulator of RNase III)
MDWWTDKMIEIKGDILKVRRGFICNQVSTQGIMNYGLGQNIRMMWPKVFNDYILSWEHNRLKLGEVVFTTIKMGKLYIATLIAQESYGLMRDKRHTDYPALGRCLNKVKEWYKTVGGEKLPIYLPHGLGCGSTSGGDWGTVSAIIKRETPEAIVVKLK